MATSIVIRNTSISAPDRRLWGTTDNFTVKGQVSGGMFSIGVVSFEEAGLGFVSPDSQLDPANRTGLAWYQFPTAPSTYEVTEPAATQIIPTQDGGKFIESQGSIFKDIKIGGTVGFRPNVPSSDLIPGARSAGLNTSPPGIVSDILFSDERGLNPKEATGMDDMIFLRNLFRFYYDVKQDAEWARKTMMIWTYAKEDEAYIVEPISFTTTRDSSSPLSWKYQIQLKSIARLNAVFEIVEDPMDLFTAFNKGLQALDQLGRDLGRALNNLANIVKYVASLPFNVANTLLRLGTQVLNGIAAVRDSFNFNKLAEGLVKNFQATATDAYNRIMEAAGADPVGVHSGAVGQAKSICRKFMSTAATLRSIDFLWEENKQVAVRDRSTAYDNEYGESPTTFGSPLNPANINIPGSAREEKIIAGENIRTIARRLTGDEANWKKLAILNNLKAPYIAPEAAQGVLGYNDRILIPQSSSAPEDLKTGRQLEEDDSYQALTKAQQKYGRDVKLLSAGSGGNLADLSVTKQGDLELIEGEDNVDQALLIKFATERGSLATHPTFGAQYTVGTKFPRLDKLYEFSLDAQKTIRQDPRVEGISDVKTFVDGDRIYFSAKVKLRMSNSKLPVTFAVRR